MSARVRLEVGRLAPETREELRRQLLALVLAFVLVWYTLVVPAHASAGGARRFEPDDDSLDGEVRGLRPAAPPAKDDSRGAEELDWPEYIYP
ncbi:MAG TPA: hypothetical protein VF736_03065 [Pyrinomonadaceae bacterium]|jgi:hypothetical protein